MENSPVLSSSPDKAKLETHKAVLALAELLGKRIRLTVFLKADGGLEPVGRDVDPKELPGITFEYTDRLLRLDVAILLEEGADKKLFRITNIHLPASQPDAAK